MAVTVAVRPTRTGPVRVTVAVAVLLSAIGAGVLVGAADLGVGRVVAEVVAQLTGGVSPLSQREAAILWQIRVPRVVLGTLVGAALAGAGAAYQSVFRNPLADPYLLGAAAGAGLGATLAVVTAPGAAGWIVGPLPLAAFVGALTGVALAWLLGRSAGAGTASLVLAGVAVTAFLTAIQTFVAQANTDDFREVYAFILGSLGTSGWSDVVLLLPYVALATVVLLVCARLLDVLAVGDEEAASLGIHPGRVRLAVVLAASLATAAAVAVAGLIGFVGIIVPHLVRLAVASSYRVVLPLSLLGGAAFLVGADILARSIVSPAELPIGVVTAFTGAPFFALVLRASRNGFR